jgi:hypothetical protein
VKQLGLRFPEASRLGRCGMVHAGTWVFSLWFPWIQPRSAHPWAPSDVRGERGTGAVGLPAGATCCGLRGLTEIAGASCSR